MGHSDGLLYDYTCKSVGEALAKYRLHPGWIAEFDAMDGVWPVVAVPVELLNANPAAQMLRLSEITEPDRELPACVLDSGQKKICFKIGSMRELIRVLGKTPCG